jgi:Domain of unknown function (DUF6946)
MAKIPRLHLPMLEPEDVVRHLGKQEQHWKEGRSTHALALSWFASKGFPKAVASALASRPDFASAELVDGFLERQVSLRTAGRNSQTDLLAIASVGEKLAIIPVEGKAGETSGDYVHQWLDASETKKTRLRSLCGTLGLSCDTAEGFATSSCIGRPPPFMRRSTIARTSPCCLVHSFADDQSGFKDFSAFVETLGVSGVAPGTLVGPFPCDGISLYAGWVQDKARKPSSPTAYLDALDRYAAKLEKECKRVRAWCAERRSKQ